MIKSVKPTSPGRRGMTYLIGKGSKSKLIKSVRKGLTSKLSGTVGRSKGRISIYNRRRGAKSRYRQIDFKRNKYNIEGVVESVEYDPNRTCEVAVILYTDGERRFILAPAGISVGDRVISGEKVPVKAGNSMPMANIPIGTPIHNIEMYPMAGGKFIRSAGGAAYITAKEGKYVNIRMPSGEIRRFLAACYATIGQIGNEEWKLVTLGKAGRSFHLGKRPKTRGKARSDGHPLGGSYSRRLGRQPVDKWGNLSKGKKTRKRSNTNKYIVRDRRLKRKG